MQLLGAPKTTGGPFSREFEDLFHEHYQLIFCTAYGVTGRVEDAEDIVQTIFLRLLRREQSLDSLRPNPRGYLYRAAVNESLTVVKAMQRRERSQVSEELAAAVPARVLTGPEETHRKLYAALAQLSSKAASILILRYLHNYSDADIAKLLGTSRGVIAVTLHRSRARLKNLLGGAFGEEL